MHDKDRHSHARRNFGRALVLAVALSVGFLAWWRIASRTVPAPRSVEISRPSAAAHGAAAMTEPPTVTKPPASGARIPVPGTTEFDACGLGKATLDANDDYAPYRYLNHVTHKTAERWLASLLDSDDTRARAAGLLMEGKIGQDDLSGRPMEDRNRDELVALAVGSGDPAVYALALSACGAFSSSTPASGTCQQLSVSTWARLDPDNVWPWLMLASQARVRKDASAESDAFDHAARARTVNEYTASLFTYAEPAMPSEASGLDRWYLTVQAVGIQSAMRPPLSSALQHCGSAPQDDGVTAQCDAVAEVMVGSATTLVDFAIGLNLGARMGWPKQRLSDLNDRRDAMLQTFVEEGEEEQKSMWNCGAVEKGNAFMHRRVQVGELEAARERMERAGESVPELARQEREYVNKIRLEAERRAQNSAPDSEGDRPYQ